MLDFSRAKAAAILLITFVVCGFAVPNFFSEQTVKSWPAWAQHRLVLSPELQGGSSTLLEVDQSDVRMQVLESLRNEVVQTLCASHITLARAPAVRGGSVEVRLGGGGFQAGFAKLRELSLPFNGVRSYDVTDAGSGFIRLTPTEATVAERVQQAVDASIRDIENRFRLLENFSVKATVRREGAHRILVQVPGFPDPSYMIEE